MRAHQDHYNRARFNLISLHSYNVSIRKWIRSEEHLLSLAAQNRPSCSNLGYAYATQC